MKHTDAILKLLMEGRSYSYIQAQLGVYPSQIATVVSKYLEPTIKGDKTTIKRELNEQQKKFYQLQEDYKTQSESVGVLEKNNRKMCTELNLKSQELNTLKKFLETLRNDYNKAFLTNKESSSAYNDLKKRLEISEQKRNELHEKLKVKEQQQENALIRFNEIIKSLEEQEWEHVIFIPKWAWPQIKELSPDNLQAFIPKS
jgi:chromosome segregation ATPase